MSDMRNLKAEVAALRAKCATLEDAEARLAKVERERDEARSLCERLQAHYDRAGPEHNLLALLDLYHERKMAAQKRAEQFEAVLREAEARSDVPDLMAEARALRGELATEREARCLAEDRASRSERALGDRRDTPMQKLCGHPWRYVRDIELGVAYECLLCRAECAEQTIAIARELLAAKDEALAEARLALEADVDYFARHCISKCQQEDAMEAIDAALALSLDPSPAPEAKP